MNFLKTFAISCVLFTSQALALPDNIAVIEEGMCNNIASGFIETYKDRIQFIRYEGHDQTRYITISKDQCDIQHLNDARISVNYSIRLYGSQSRYVRATGTATCLIAGDTMTNWECFAHDAEYVYRSCTYESDDCNSRKGVYRGQSKEGAINVGLSQFLSTNL